jgi:hypothetical protein
MGIALVSFLCAVEKRVLCIRHGGMGGEGSAKRQSLGILGGEPCERSRPESFTHRRWGVVRTGSSATVVIFAVLGELPKWSSKGKGTEKRRLSVVVAEEGELGKAPVGLGV